MGLGVSRVGFRSTGRPEFPGEGGGQKFTNGSKNYPYFPKREKGGRVGGEGGGEKAGVSRVGFRFTSRPEFSGASRREEGGSTEYELQSFACGVQASGRSEFSGASRSEFPERGSERECV